MMMVILLKIQRNHASRKYRENVSINLLKKKLCRNSYIEQNPRFGKENAGKMITTKFLFTLIFLCECLLVCFLIKHNTVGKRSQMNDCVTIIFNLEVHMIILTILKLAYVLVLE